MKQQQYILPARTLRQTHSALRQNQSKQPKPARDSALRHHPCAPRQEQIKEPGSCFIQFQGKSQQS
ncbi:hypothetical protein A2U01_0107106, partial [Trifolium medium]|nr:hypothetical protein [Trifolium medium]